MPNLKHLLGFDADPVPESTHSQVFWASRSFYSFVLSLRRQLACGGSVVERLDSMLPAFLIFYSRLRLLDKETPSRAKLLEVVANRLIAARV